ncbi:MAG: hypothetical protein V4577_29960 [Bacteroidota bacterium]
MKNKAVTYLLGAVVIVVWGLILYRVFAAVGGDDDEIPVVNPIKSKEAYNDFAIPKDTSKLLLNYRDPFGLVKQKDTATISVRRNISSQATGRPRSVAPAFNWGFIQYSGYIRNPASKKMITMVVINGQNFTMTEGDTRAGVKLFKNMRDSIKIGFQGKTKFITIKPATL